MEQDASFTVQVDRTMMTTTFNTMLARAARQIQKRDGYKIAANSIYDGLIAKIVMKKHRMIYETVYRFTDILGMCATSTLPPELTIKAITESWLMLIPHNAIAVQNLSYALGKVFNLARSVAKGKYTPSQLSVKQRATMNDSQRIMFMKLTNVGFVLPQNILTRFCVPEEERAQLLICTLECSLEQHGPSVTLVRLQQILTFCGQLNLSSLTDKERTNFYATMTRSVYNRIFEPCRTLDSETAKNEIECAINLTQHFYTLAGDAFIFLNRLEDIFASVLHLLESDALHCACWWLFSAVTESHHFRGDDSARECQGVLVQIVEKHCHIETEERVQGLIFRPIVAQLGVWRESVTINLLNGLGFPLKLFLDQRREIEEETHRTLRTLVSESLDLR